MFAIMTPICGHAQQESGAGQASGASTSTLTNLAQCMSSGLHQPRQPASTVWCQSVPADDAARAILHRGQALMKLHAWAEAQQSAQLGLDLASAAQDQVTMFGAKLLLAELQACHNKPDAALQLVADAEAMELYLHTDHHVQAVQAKAEYMCVPAPPSWRRYAVVQAPVVCVTTYQCRVCSA